MENFIDDKLYKYRCTQAEKDKNKKAWYKHYADMYARRTGSTGLYDLNYDRKHNMKMCYDLYNNIINIDDFKHIIKPYGEDVGDMPADFTNKDISSQNIKVMVGMQMRRPFSYHVLAVNEEATTRKEQEEFGRMKEYVQSEIMRPIMQVVEEQAMQEQQGRELTPEEQEAIQQSIQEQIQAQTPDEVKKYMAREHQDPAEAQATQLLNYLVSKLKIREISNDLFKHMCLGGEEIGLITIVNGEPAVIIANPLDAEYEDDGKDYFQDKEWISVTYNMTPSQVIEFFNDSPEGLSEKEIDDIYEMNLKSSQNAFPDNDFTFSNTYHNSAHTVAVKHVCFKAPAKIGFLYYEDEDGEEQMMEVDENYKLQPEFGDIRVEWEWIPQAHEAWIIGNKYYKKCRPVPGQYKDPNDLYKCKLPYYGVSCDNMNSEPTSPMMRQVHWQMLYNIIWYRAENLIASDKGKGVLVSMGIMPKSEGYGLKEFMYYLDNTGIGFVNSAEEGQANMPNGDDISKSVKEIDRSMIADLQKYMMILEYLEKRCGLSIGITDAMRGMAQAREAVTNNQMNVTQSSFILEPYYELHNRNIRELLTGLLEIGKVAYSGKDSVKLSYVIDDLSMSLYNIDMGLLNSSTFGLFVSDSGEAWDIKNQVNQLGFAAMQNQKAEFSDIIKVLRSQSLQEAEELLTVAEQNAHERAQQLERMRGEEQRATLERAEQYAQQEHERLMERDTNKEEERRKTVIVQASITGASFNPDIDADGDGRNDFLEIANTQIAADRQKLEEEKFIHQKGVDNAELKLKEKELAQKPKANDSKK